LAPIDELSRSMKKPVVFISYSRRDEAEKDKLVSHLEVLQGTGLFSLWTEDCIGVGENWQLEMAQAIAETKVAVLLVTAEFLNSQLALRREIPELLARHRKEELIVIPVIARACAWQAIDWLRELSVRPRNGVPVWSEGGTHVDEHLSAIAAEILQIVRGNQDNGLVVQLPDDGDQGPDREVIKRILVVDDEPSWQNRLSRILREIDCTVVTADNYEQAESLLPKFDFDLVTIDLNLDKSTRYADGLELALRIRERYGPRIPIIIITGTGSLEEQRRAFKDYNVFDFIQKAKLDLEEFQNVVTAALGNDQP
jgi:CheY-like chemotaxis protein